MRGNPIHRGAHIAMHQLILARFDTNRLLLFIDFVKGLFWRYQEIFEHNFLFVNLWREEIALWLIQWVLLGALGLLYLKGERDELSLGRFLRGLVVAEFLNQLKIWFGIIRFKRMIDRGLLMIKVVTNWVFHQELLIKRFVIGSWSDAEKITVFVKWRRR